MWAVFPNSAPTLLGSDLDPERPYLLASRRTECKTEMFMQVGICAATFVGVVMLLPEVQEQRD